MLHPVFHMFMLFPNLPQIFIAFILLSVIFSNSSSYVTCCFSSRFLSCPPLPVPVIMTQISFFMHECFQLACHWNKKPTPLGYDDDVPQFRKANNERQTTNLLATTPHHLRRFWFCCRIKFDAQDYKIFNKICEIKKHILSV